MGHDPDVLALEIVIHRVEEVVADPGGAAAGDEASPVRCRPDHRFGRPTIAGISTAAIVEHLDGGETESEVAEQFDLGLESVRWAAAYETSRVAAQAA